MFSNLEISKTFERHSFRNESSYARSAAAFAFRSPASDLVLLGCCQTVTCRPKARSAGLTFRGARSWFANSKQPKIVIIMIIFKPTWSRHAKWFSRFVISHFDGLGQIAADRICRIPTRYLSLVLILIHNLWFVFKLLIMVYYSLRLYF